MNGDVLFHQSAPNCVTMAAGSDRQPIESSVVPVCGKPTTNPLTRLPATVRNIPYSDHNYGKPLTPPDSCSPDHPEEADTGNEDEGFTRCICGFKHDDGYMICCDRCSAWQHVECVGIKSNCVPDTYLCDMCDPRPLDKKRAIQIQSKKVDDQTDEDDDEDGDVSDHDSDNGVSRQSLPNSAAMKENVLTKGKRKKRESTRKLNQKEMKHNKRKRRKKKHISSTDTIPVDEDTNGPWPFPDHRNYEEAQKTVYIGDWENCSVPSLEQNANFNNVLRPEQICKVVDVQRNKKGVVVTEDIDGQQFIIECKGNLMLESKFREDHPMFSKCDPFVLYYTKLELVMNFSLYGNDARFIRRSCSPTAEVRDVMVGNKPHLAIYSMTPLAKGTEVTLAFEFPFHEYRRPLECACAQDDCMVRKHNATILGVEQTNGYRSKDEHGLVDSSLSNHMDSDSEGDNNVKDKRSRKKMSREDRKLQQYLRQFEKMEKTEKKKQQHTSNGRDARTGGILTQRNFPEEFNVNGETPSKPGKALRKQGLSQRPQRKIQAIRRGHRLPSCSSEPLSPEDNYSSAASTPTTPCVNVVEENNEHHLHHHHQQQHHETPEKSFKFPKFKKGSMNDVTSSSVDAPQSNNPSPEAPAYPSPSKSSVSMLEARLVDVDEYRLSNHHATINGASSPTTDPNCSPSSCHSTYASPTHSESVDLGDMFSRHPSSPTGSSVASYILSSGVFRSNPTYTTLKKRWLLQYAKERPVKKLPPNGVITTTVYRPSELSRVVFPLPYKRRKLMEYQRSVNNPISKQNVDTTFQTVIVRSLPETAASVSSINTSTSTSVLTAMTSSSSTSPSSTSSVTSVTSVTLLSVTSSVPTVSVPSLDNFSSAPTNNTRLTMLSGTRTTTSGGLTVTGSNDAVFSRVTGSEDASWRRRISGGSDDTSVGRSSLSSISSTDDIKMDVTATSSDSVKNELNLANAVGSSSEANRKPPVPQAVQENSLESSTDCVNKEDTSRDKTANVGSSGVVEGSGATSTTQTTPGGKKKVSLTEYLSRKRTTGSVVKKEAAPGPSSSDVTSANQSRVSDTGSLLASSEPVSSVVNYRGSLGTSVKTSAYCSTLLSSTGVSSSTSGIEPVSPEEGYHVEDDRPSLSTNAHGPSAVVEREAKSSLAPTPFRSYSQNLPIRPLSEPGSSSDAMDIDDDDVPSSSNIVVNTPVISLPGARPAGVTSSDMVSSLANKSYSNIGQPIRFNTVTSAQQLPGRPVTNSIVAQANPAVRQPVPVSQVPNTSLQPLPPRHPDFRSANSRPSPFH